MGEGEYTRGREAEAGSSQIGIYSLPSDENSLFVTHRQKSEVQGSSKIRSIV